jgi:acyl transferase domain-containing protein
MGSQLIKCKIGHLEGGAGVAAVVKSVMMLERGTIPPNIHFNTPNPAIKFDEWNIKIPTAVTPWPTEGLRRISINSFGYGGTNAHAILDDAYSYLTQNGLDGVHYTKAPKTKGTGKPNGAANSTRSEPISRLFAISAQDKDGVGRVKKSLASFLEGKGKQLHTEQESNDYLADLAFTLNERRSHLQWKTFSTASSIDELLEVLTSEEYTTPTYRSSRKHRLGFVFTGQGAQWANMGMELLKYKTFRDSITAADAYLREELECAWSATEELARGKSTSNIKIALYSQTLCTVLQVALVDLLREWDIVPASVVGHSSGEIGAAYCLGVLSREDAWKVAYFRGLLSSNLRESGHEGAMMAVGASPEDVEEMISQHVPGEVHVACINSPQSITVSGDVEGVDKFLDVLLAKGVFARKLQVDTAYHSPHMQLVAQDYYEAIADISTNSPTGDCKMYSSVSGSVVEPSELGPAYWVRNLVSPVQFASAVQNLIRPLNEDSSRSEDNAVDILVEIGPHSALQGPTTQSLKAIGLTDIPYYSALTRLQSGIETALTLAGTLFAKGFPVNFSQINQVVRKSQTLVDLPSYPWNHSRVRWAESRVVKEYRLREPSQQPWIADHKIQGTILYPAAGFIAFAIEAALAGAEPTQKVTKLRLRDIQLTAAIIVTEDEPVEYSVSLRPHLTATRETSATWSEFIVTSSRGGSALERNCLGLIMVEYESSNDKETVLKDEALMASYREATALCKTAIRPDEFYEELTAIGLQYGPVFQNVTDVRTGPEQSCCTVDIPDVGLGTPHRPHVIHPGTLDAIFHMAFAAMSHGPWYPSPLMRS